MFGRIIPVCNGVGGMFTLVGGTGAAVGIRGVRFCCSMSLRICAATWGGAFEGSTDPCGGTGGWGWEGGLAFIGFGVSAGTFVWPEDGAVLEMAMLLPAPPEGGGGWGADDPSTAPADTV